MQNSLKPFAFFVLFFMVLVSSSVQAQEIKWLRSATQAAREAKQTGKPILIYVRSENCRYCDLMQSNVWENAETSGFVLRNFIPLKLTREENQEAVAAMKVKGFPATIIFNSEREYVSRIDGYVPPQEFMKTVSGVRTASRQATTNQ